MPEESEPPVREFADRGVLWLLESPQNLRDVVRMLSSEIAESLDFSRAERHNRSFVPDDLHKQEADLLYRIPLLAGRRSVWIYVLLEHQSRPDRTMGLRVLSYMVQIWQAQVRGWQDTKTPVSKWKLSPVLPVVFYTGRRRWTTPISLIAMMELAPVLEASVPQWDTLFLNLQTTPGAMLEEANSPVAQAFRALQAVEEPAPVLGKILHEVTVALDTVPDAEVEIWKKIMLFLYLLVRHNRSAGEQEALFEEMDRAVTRHRVALEETKMTGAQVLINEGRQQGRVEGLVEGRVEGRAEGREDVVIELLRVKFGQVSEVTEAKVRGLSAEQLMDVARMVMQAAELADLGL